MAMGSLGGGNQGPGTLAEINVTPLVDVMLVLLIIFMVTSSVETVRMERQLEKEKQVRVERDLVPRKPEPPKNPLKDVPVVVPNTQVKQIKESEQKEPKVVLGSDLVFRLDATPVVDCVALTPKLATLPKDGTSDEADALFDQCVKVAAEKIGPNVLIQEKKRVNFAADRSIPWGWATKFMAVMGMQHGVKQVNVIATSPPSEGAEP